MQDRPFGGTGWKSSAVHSIRAWMPKVQAALGDDNGGK